MEGYARIKGDQKLYFDTINTMGEIEIKKTLELLRDALIVSERDLQDIRASDGVASARYTRTRFAALRIEQGIARAKNRLKKLHMESHAAYTELFYTVSRETLDEDTFAMIEAEVFRRSEQ